MTDRLDGQTRLMALRDAHSQREGGMAASMRACLSRNAWGGRAAMAGIGLLAQLALMAPPARAADSQQALRFAPGTSSASVSGTVGGSDTAIYTLKARAGQTLTVVLSTAGSDACIFDVSKPDGSFLFNGTTGGGAFTGTLPADAAYQLSVFQMRAAILEGQSCRYTLAVSVN